MKQRLGPAFARATDARRILILLPAIIVVLLIGCGTRKISKTELRAITTEIVTSTQRISGRKPEVTIRPQLQLSKTGMPAKLAADNIYISLFDASQVGAIAQGLNEIARRHQLSVSETTSDGVTRFDYAYNDVRTHTIHVVTPLTLHSHPAVKPGGSVQRRVVARPASPGLIQ